MRLTFSQAQITKNTADRVLVHRAEYGFLDHELMMFKAVY